VTISYADVLVIAPELGTAAAQAKVPTSPTGDQIVVDVLLFLSPLAWGPRYDLACKYLAAHRAALTLRGALGASGAVTQEQVGSVSRSYANSSPMGTHPDYDLTPFGKMFKALLLAMPQRLGCVA
jgi:hypothetical protein